MTYKIIWFDGNKSREQTFSNKIDAMAHYSLLKRSTLNVVVYLKDRENWVEFFPEDMGEGYVNKTLLID